MKLATNLVIFKLTTSGWKACCPPCNFLLSRAMRPWEAWTLYTRSALEVLINIKKWGFYVRRVVAGAGTSNYIPHILQHVITCPCPWYLLLAQQALYIVDIFLSYLLKYQSLIYFRSGNIICFQERLPTHDYVTKWKHILHYWQLINRWIPLTDGSEAELWCFLSSVPEQTVE